MQIALRKVIQKQMSHRDFETLARCISRDIVHQIAILPVLIDRCVERLVKLAEEDTLLQLYDYCHGPNIDPVTVKSQCLAIAPDAYYRIQMDTTTVSLGNVRFCCLEHTPLLVYPEASTTDDPEDGGTGAAGNNGSNFGDDMDTGDDDRAGTPNAGMDTDDGERMDDDNNDHRTSEPKRARYS
jgi:hypothetical protein